MFEVAIFSETCTQTEIMILSPN